MGEAPTFTRELPAAPAPVARIGRPHDLLWLILFGTAALFLIQFTGLFILVNALRPAHPQATPNQLLRLAAQEAQTRAFFVVPATISLYLVLTLFIYMRVRRLAGTAFWSALAWRPVEWPTVWRIAVAGVALALLIQLGTQLFPPEEPPAIEKLFTSRAAAFLILGASLIFAPFFEELIFRGYLYGIFAPAWGVGPAVFITGILFGLLHAPQLFPGWVQMASLCVVGILFSLVRARTGSLRASVLMHLAYNATITGFFLTSRDFSELSHVVERAAALWACLLGG